MANIYGNQYWDDRHYYRGSAPYDPEKDRTEISDNEVRQSIEEAMRHDKYLKQDVADIDVEVEDGIATLNGSVSNRFAKWEAQRDAYWSDGVIDIIDNLKVRRKR